jgi:hypothetical protein
MRPLDGLVVLDLSRLLPGAAATMQLANFGAQVIKIEEPERGDYGRWLPPYLDGEGAVFRMVNRGKQSVALDLKSDGGRQALLKLAASADVLVESFRPGTMQRLDLGYETLALVRAAARHSWRRHASLFVRRAHQFLYAHTQAVASLLSSRSLVVHHLALVWQPARISVPHAPQRLGGPGLRVD